MLARRLDALRTLVPHAERANTANFLEVRSTWGLLTWGGLMGFHTWESSHGGGAHNNVLHVDTACMLPLPRLQEVIKYIIRLKDRNDQLESAIDILRACSKTGGQGGSSGSSR